MYQFLLINSSIIHPIHLILMNQLQLYHNLQLQLDYSFYYHHKLLHMLLLELFQL